MANYISIDQLEKIRHQAAFTKYQREAKYNEYSEYKNYINGLNNHIKDLDFSNYTINTTKSIQQERKKLNPNKTTNDVLAERINKFK